jgi:hypothetical protein
MRPIGIPFFSSPPELALAGAVTALSASDVEEMRDASFTARSIAGVSIGVSTSDCSAPSSINASTTPADALSRMPMTTGLWGLAEMTANSAVVVPRRSAIRIVRVPGFSIAAAEARLSAWRSAHVDSSMGPSWPQSSRSGVAMSASGFFDLNELPPGLLLEADSFCAVAPNSDRACMDPQPFRAGFSRAVCCRGDMNLWPVSSRRQ